MLHATLARSVGMFSALLPFYVIYVTVPIHPDLSMELSAQCSELFAALFNDNFV